MAELKPFKALRFTKDAGAISELVCPPYDIISDAEREQYVKANPNNIVRLELPVGEDRYAAAGALLRDMMEKGLLRQDEADAIYIYEEEFDALGRRMSIKGFISRIRLEEFSRGVVLPHEETLSKAKTDRFNLMCSTFCNFSAIYSLYMDDERQTARFIDGLSSGAADAEFTDGDGVTHRLWAVTDGAAIKKLQDDFADRQVYIADGHHRYETGLNFRNSLREAGKLRDNDGAPNFIMMMFVDMQNDGLVVFPTHRLVRGLADFDAKKLLDGVQEFFDVSRMPGTEDIERELAENSDMPSFALYTGEAGYYMLRLRDRADVDAALPGLCPSLRALDVTVLHSLILERVLGIDKENMAKQINLTYTRDAAEALSGVRAGEFTCAFLLNPTKVREIQDVALENAKMPQKSTYFYPKLITGMVMNYMEDAE